MSLNSPMTSGGAQPVGGGGAVKHGDNLDTPFTSYPCPIPAMTESGDTYDHHITPEFSQPHVHGGLPVEFFERVTGSPGTLESTLEDENNIARKAYSTS